MYRQNKRSAELVKSLEGNPEEKGVTREEREAEFNNAGVGNYRSYKVKRGFYYSQKIFSLICIALSLVALIGVIVFVFRDGIPALTPHFLFEMGDGTLEDATLPPAFLGTFYIILISLILAAPLGIATAVFLNEYTVSDTWYVKTIRVSIETLASIPSIVYGIFGYLVFVVGRGYSIWSGGVTLAIMILPTIVKNTEEALKEVPNSMREASLALGATKVRTIFRVVLPTAAPGIITSIILSIGRVVSESAVLLLTMGNAFIMLPTSIADSGTSLALVIYLYSTFGYTDKAAATAVVLLFIVLFLNLLSYLMLYLIERKRNHHGK